MEQSLYFLLGWGAPIVSALFALYLVRTINSHSPGTEQMQRISVKSGLAWMMNVSKIVMMVYGMALKQTVVLDLLKKLQVKLHSILALV